jgi:hypothetical protein
MLATFSQSSSAVFQVAPQSSLLAAALLKSSSKVLLLLHYLHPFPVSDVVPPHSLTFPVSLHCWLGEDLEVCLACPASFPPSRQTSANVDSGRIHGMSGGGDEQGRCLNPPTSIMPILRSTTLCTSATTTHELVS